MVSSKDSFHVHLSVLKHCSDYLGRFFDEVDEEAALTCDVGRGYLFASIYLKSCLLSRKLVVMVLMTNTWNI
jgi:hypothetical protein